MFFFPRHKIFHPPRPISRSSFSISQKHISIYAVLKYLKKKMFQIFHRPLIKLLRVPTQMQRQVSLEHSQVAFTPTDCQVNLIRSYIQLINLYKIISLALRATDDQTRSILLARPSFYITLLVIKNILTSLRVIKLIIVPWKTFFLPSTSCGEQRSSERKETIHTNLFLP